MVTLSATSTLRAQRRLMALRSARWGLLAIVSFTVTAIMSAPVVLIFIPIVFPVAVALALPGLEALRDECVAGPVGAVRAHDFWRDSMVVREEMDIHRVGGPSRK